MPTIVGSGTMYSLSAVSRENQRIIFPFSMGRRSSVGFI